MVFCSPRWYWPNFPILKVSCFTLKLWGIIELISLCYLAQNITNLSLIIMVCEPHLSVRMESNHRPLKYQFSTLPLSYVPGCRDSRIRTCEFSCSQSRRGNRTPQYPEYKKHPIELFHQDIHWPAHHSLLITLTHFLRCCATPGVFAENKGIEPSPVLPGTS